MRKVFYTLLSISILCLVACSKDDVNHEIPIGLYPEVLVGKWSFHSSEGINIPLDAHDQSPFVDTLIFSKLGTYIFIDNSNTSDHGKYTLGENKGINDIEKKQIYDSILLKTEYITQSEETPSVLYFKMNEDTLIINYSYNDRFLKKKLIKYIKK